MAKLYDIRLAREQIPAPFAAAEPTVQLFWFDISAPFSLPSELT
jgi:hypothetical protein